MARVHTTYLSSLKDLTDARNSHLVLVSKRRQMKLIKIIMKSQQLLKNRKKWNIGIVIIESFSEFCVLHNITNCIYHIH